jgi:lysophospholipase L1-like esterase
MKARVFVSGIMVEAMPGARAVVTFGDSITDGNASTPGANHRWPDFLARRLAKASSPVVAVLTEGICGAKVLSDRMGAL